MLIVLFLQKLYTSERTKLKEITAALLTGELGIDSEFSKFTNGIDDEAFPFLTSAAPDYKQLSKIELELVINRRKRSEFDLEGIFAKTIPLESELEMFDSAPANAEKNVVNSLNAIPLQLLDKMLGSLQEKVQYFV